MVAITCGFLCALASSTRTIWWVALASMSGFGVAAAAVGFQTPGSTLSTGARAFCAYAGPWAAIALPLALRLVQYVRRRRGALTSERPALLLAMCSFCVAFLAGLSLWGSSPTNDAALFGFGVGFLLAMLGAGAASILVSCLPPAELKLNIVALAFGVASVVVGVSAVADHRTLSAVSGHSYRGW